MFRHLFQPGRIGSMELKNRILMAPMVRNYADPDGGVTARYERHIERIAEGGVAAITLEASYVAKDGKGFRNQLGLHNDGMIAGLRRLVEAAHRHSAKIGPQLFHAGRQTLSATTGLPIVAPSAIPCPLEQEMPRALLMEEIGAIVRQFGHAARRAREAGCDYVEIHAAHGYLIAEFLSGFANTRTDDYGGSLENRMRFLKEVYGSVRAAVGDRFPIIVRISGEERLPHGLDLAQTSVICKTLEALGVDAVHITSGAYGSYTTGRMISPMSVPDAPLASLAETIHAAVSIPVITVDKIRHPELAEELIAKGVADFVALGRPLLADPDWPKKAEAGDVAEINTCIACQEGCMSRLFDQQDVWCLSNPAAGHEATYDVAAAESPKMVMVVGGGPAGMAAALSADRAGHEVDLYEVTSQLGGQLFDAEAAPHREGWAELRRNLTYRIHESDVTVHLGARMTADLIDQARPDVVVLATGSFSRPAAWPTDGSVTLLDERDVLRGRAKAGPRVVVAGGGCSGAETAEFLAVQGHAVTLIEKKTAIAEDAPLDEQALLLGRLQQLGVSTVAGSVIEQVYDGQVYVATHAGSDSIPADTVVVCQGADPDDALERALGGGRMNILRVGDCVEPRQVLEAIAEGTEAGWTLRQPVLTA